MYKSVLQNPRGFSSFEGRQVQAATRVRTASKQCLEHVHLMRREYMLIFSFRWRLLVPHFPPISTSLVWGKGQRQAMARVMEATR